MKSRIMLAVLACLLGACSDQPTPLGPDAAGSVSLNNGGAPTPIDAQFVDDFASAVCGFTVVTKITGKVKVLAFPKGRVLVIGPAFTITFTNATTGRSVTRAVTGASHNTSLPNGNTEIVLTGSNAIAVLGEETFFLFLNGRFTYVVDSNGIIVQGLEGNGKREDVCPLLA
jgi:hypothetical protein